jgi:hypothetical protein
LDDTLPFHENNDGDPANDGPLWHSHRMVLIQACGAGALGVRASPSLPAPTVDDVRGVAQAIAVRAGAYGSVRFRKTSSGPTAGLTPSFAEAVMGRVFRVSVTAQPSCHA